MLSCESEVVEAKRDRGWNVDVLWLDPKRVANIATKDDDGELVAEVTLLIRCIKYCRDTDARW